MSDGHYFDVLHIHEQAGELDVRWDDKGERVITCRIPVDENGLLLPPEEFRKAIMRQCLDRLTHWDRMERSSVQEAGSLVGQRFDVTEDFMLRDVGTASTRQLTSGFALEDHI